jgi:hypothetical protein
MDVQGPSRSNFTPSTRAVDDRLSRYERANHDDNAKVVFSWMITDAAHRF